VTTPPQAPYGQPQQPAGQQPMPYGQPPMPYGPPPQKKRGMPKWVWAVGVVFVIVIIAVAAGSAGKKKNTDGTSAASVPSTNPAASAPGAAAPAAKPNVPEHSEDVAITSCAPDPATGFLAAGVTVTNHSSKTSNYAITIAFDSKDGKTQLDTGLVAVNDLNSGQSAPQTALGFSRAPAGGYVCKVADITRYAS
jgi:hypothetical protein